MPKEESSLFVKFDNPAALRRSLLEASKDVLVVLQNSENFKDARNKKAELTNRLRNQVAEITQLFNKLKLELPKTSIPKEKSEKRVVVRKIGKKDELKSIEEQLADIESQLGSLG